MTSASALPRVARPGTIQPGRVFVLGNAGVDLLMPLPRLPRPGETLVGGALRRAPGGKGLNQAVMAARAGAAVHFCAPLGGDADGAWVTARLRAERFAALDLPTPCPCTDTSILLVARDGENMIVTAGACADALDAERAAAFASGAGPGDVLLLQGNLSHAATLAAARRGHAIGARVMLNTAPLRWPVKDVLACCWAVVANAGEAAELTGRHGLAAAQALAEMGLALVVVTMGAGGCASVPGGLHPAVPVAAVDSAGAGDAFCGVLAAALVQGWAAAPAIAAAQRAAADTVTRHGAFDALPASFAF